MVRRFPPLGVKAVPSYSSATEKGGVAHQVAHQVAHAFDHPNAPLSEGRALAVVVQAVPGNPHGTWVSRVLNNTGKRDCPRRRPPLARRRSRRTRGGESGGSDPPLFAAGAAPGSVHRRTQWRTINTPLEGGRSLHRDPCGKASRPNRIAGGRNYVLQQPRLMTRSLEESLK